MNATRNGKVTVVWCSSLTRMKSARSHRSSLRRVDVLLASAAAVTVPGDGAPGGGLSSPSVWALAAEQGWVRARTGGSTQARASELELLPLLLVPLSLVVTSEASECWRARRRGRCPMGDPRRSEKGGSAPRRKGGVRAHSIRPQKRAGHSLDRQWKC